MTRVCRSNSDLAPSASELQMGVGLFGRALINDGWPRMTGEQA